ncbi:MAG: putative lipid II flippase FtsW [Chitinispirillales bacterium]|nr:putative lipid II flippase FtsW [Chitinispirillales bacterium]
MSSNKGRMDFGLFIAALVLLGFGIVLVYSSSFAVAQRNFGGADFFLSRQLTRAFLAIVFFTFFINFDYRYLTKYSGIIFIGAVILLVFVLTLPDSAAIKGAKRWITIMGIRFQVSDFARVALILFLAKKCGEDGMNFDNWRSLIPHYLSIGVICGLVVLEPDFSTAMILLVTAFGILFMAGAKVRHLLASVALVIPFAVLLIFRTPYRMRRVLGFMNLSEESSNLGYQVFQSLVGLGHGGLLGVGLGRGEQKYFYLPEPHTDFILSILGEEFGFVGIALVFLIFAFIVYRGFSISLNAPDRAGQLTAFGFTTVTAIYLLIHSGVVTGLIPPTGVPMPFLSYGGMSLIFTMSSMGILLNISSRANLKTRRMAAMSSNKQKPSENFEI